MERLTRAMSKKNKKINKNVSNIASSKRQWKFYIRPDRQVLNKPYIQATNLENELFKTFRENDRCVLACSYSKNNKNYFMAGCKRNFLSL